MKVVEVYLKQNNKSIDQPFFYKPAIDQKVEAGMRVLVPFGRGNRELEGFVTRLVEIDKLSYAVKSLLMVLDREPVLNQAQIELCLWMKFYYCSLFYDNLSYFISPVRVKKEAYIRLNFSEVQFEYPELKFLDKYFKNHSKEVPERNIKKEDREVLKKMIEKRFISRKDVFSVSPVVEEKHYTLVRADENFKAGKNQEAILKLLNYKPLTDSELKQLIPNYRTSLSGLIRKGLVRELSDQEYKLSKVRNNALTIQSVFLSENEKEIYHKYRELDSDGSFFKGSDSASKYRILFKIIEEKLRLNQTVVFLMPEINLTFHKFELFYKYFGELVGLYNHRLTVKEQRKFWQGVKSGEIRLIIGVQGALFLPFQHLGLIIVDNESDPLYYSMGSPKFHLPVLVKKYALLHKCQYLFLDEIPSINTYYHILQKKIGYFEIDKGANSRIIKIIDMQNELKDGNLTPIGRELNSEILRNFSDKKLTVILANRTGYSKAVLCRKCGQIQKCPNCKVALTYNEGNSVLECQYCGYQEKTLNQCRYCGNNELRHLGIGLEKLKDYLVKRYPKLKILAVQGGMTFKDIEKVNDLIKNHEIDLLIGTQILNKHFNFTNVGLAVCFLIDRDLNLGSYDAAEGTYQVYSRFFKKALNFDSLGFIQTNDSQNDLIMSIVEDNYRTFYQGELEFRKTMKFPPFYNLAILRISHGNQEIAKNDALRLYFILKEGLEQKSVENYSIYKPATLEYNSNERFEEQIMVKIINIQDFQNIYHEIIERKGLDTLKSKISLQIKN
ncbi:primosomal protein N' [Eubacteriaceae bacterium ES3]|nr:primosomal protein N' [Eubacteriaceae bacterium ES3]